MRYRQSATAHGIWRVQAMKLRGTEQKRVRPRERINQLINMIVQRGHSRDRRVLDSGYTMAQTVDDLVRAGPVLGS